LHQNKNLGRNIVQSQQEQPGFNHDTVKSFERLLMMAIRDKGVDAVVLSSSLVNEPDPVKRVTMIAKTLFSGEIPQSVTDINNRASLLENMKLFAKKLKEKEGAK
jgi:hypothetical protein